MHTFVFFLEINYFFFVGILFFVLFLIFFSIMCCFVFRVFFSVFSFFCRSLVALIAKECERIQLYTLNQAGVYIVFFLCFIFFFGFFLHFQTQKQFE